MKVVRLLLEAGAESKMCAPATIYGPPDLYHLLHQYIENSLFSLSGVVSRPRFGYKTSTRRTRDALETACETPGETSCSYKYEAGPPVS